jgi:hypothetical protein
MNDIKVFEEVFSDEDSKLIVKKINDSSWKFGHSGVPNAYRVFWFMQLRDDPFFSKHLFDIVQFKIGAQCDLKRVFANGQTFGQDGDWHTDSEDKNRYTFVYYVNEEWKRDWGGETAFLLNNKVIGITPKHNNGVFFPATMMHSGRAPSRDSYRLRITVAFHFEVLNWLK